MAKYGPDGNSPGLGSEGNRMSYKQKFAKQRAKKILVYYFKLLFEATGEGLPKDWGDCQAEIEGIIEDIAEMVQLPAAGFSEEEEAG
jgi:hypothetical protein